MGKAGHGIILRNTLLAYGGVLDHKNSESSSVSFQPFKPEQNPSKEVLKPSELPKVIQIFHSSSSRNITLDTFIIRKRIKIGDLNVRKKRLRIWRCEFSSLRM